MKKRLFALVLVVLLLLSFAACANKAAPISEKKTIVGKWKWEMDFGPIISQQLADSGMEEFFDFSGVKMQLNWEFKADGTAAIAVDTASSEQMLDTIEDAYVQGITAYCASLNLSLEDLGVTEEEIVAQVMEEFDIDTLSEGIMQSGKYELVGDKLFMWDEGTENNENEYMTVTLDGDTLTFVSAVGAADSFPEGVLPATLTRIG